jgi:hypothetical protein
MNCNGRNAKLFERLLCGIGRAEGAQIMQEGF